MFVHKRLASFAICLLLVIARQEMGKKHGMYLPSSGRDGVEVSPKPEEKVISGDQPSQEGGGKKEKGEDVPTKQKEASSPVRRSTTSQLSA